MSSPVKRIDVFDREYRNRSATPLGRPSSRQPAIQNKHCPPKRNYEIYDALLQFKP